MKFDFETAVHEALTKSIEGGVVDKIVTDNVNKAVQQAFADQFASYSPFTKAVKEAVSAALEFNPDKFDIARYHMLVRSIVQTRVQDLMTKQFAVELDKSLEDLYRPVPAEMKLSELVAAFVEENEKDYDRKSADRASVKIETSDYGFTYIELNPDGSGKKYYDHSTMLLGINKEGEIFSVSIASETIDKKFFLRRGSEFERLLVGLYLQKSRLILDSYNSAYKEPPEDECHCD